MKTQATQELVDYINYQTDNKYDIKIEDGEVTVQHPTHINVYDCMLEESKSCWRLSNDKMVVDIWKNVINIHVTVLK